MYGIKNTVQLIGSLADDPVIRGEAPNGRTARFSILIEDSYLNSRGIRVRETQKHRVFAQGKMASTVESKLYKGMLVAVVGRLVSRHFFDAEGRARHVADVMVTELLILDMQVLEEAGPYFVSGGVASGLMNMIHLNDSGGGY